MKLIALDKMLRLSAKNINPNSHDLILANKMNPDKTSMIKFSLNLCRCNFRITYGLIMKHFVVMHGHFVDSLHPS